MVGGRGLGFSGGKSHASLAIGVFET